MSSLLLPGQVSGSPRSSTIGFEEWLPNIIALLICFWLVLFRQGSSGVTSSADEFFDAALAWFGDPDPRIGTARKKGERMAILVAHRRALLVLDSLEPHQYPSGSQRDG